MTRLPRLVAASALAAAAAVGSLTVAGSTTAPSAAPKVSVHWSDGDPVMAGMATSTSTAQYAFSSVVGGKAVRWNPCAPIHWRSRSTYAPGGSGAVMVAAVAAVSKATGIKFIYDGSTTTAPTSAWLPKDSSSIRPLLIGFTDGSHSDLLRNQPAAVLGMTRTAYFGSTVNGLPVAATKAAVIALDRTNRLPLTGPVSWKAVMEHELGHAMGLAHVGNGRELMYPVLSRSIYSLQAGDLSGLYRLGRSQGCINLGF